MKLDLQTHSYINFGKPMELCLANLSPLRPTSLSHPKINQEETPRKSKRIAAKSTIANLETFTAAVSNISDSAASSTASSAPNKASSTVESATTTVSAPNNKVSASATASTPTTVSAKTTVSALLPALGQITATVPLTGSETLSPATQVSTKTTLTTSGSAPATRPSVTSAVSEIIPAATLEVPQSATPTSTAALTAGSVTSSELEETSNQADLLAASFFETESCPCGKVEPGHFTGPFICCDQCQQWWHSNCVGLNRKQTNLFKKHNIPFKCMFCLASSLRSNKNIASKLNSKLAEPFKLSKRAYKKKINSPHHQTQDHQADKVSNSENIILSTVDSSPPSGVTPSQPEASPLSQTTASTLPREYSAHSSTLPGATKVGEREQVSVSQQTSSSITRKETVNTSPDSSLDQASLGANTLNAGNVTEISQGSSEANPRDQIIIIDHITDKSAFFKSKQIQKELSKFSKCRVKEAYSLARGGVCLRFHSTLDRDSVFDSLTAEAFGGGQKKKLRSEKRVPLVLLGVDTGTDVADIKNTLVNKASSEDIECRRLFNRYTNRPRKIVQVSCSESVANKLLVLIIKDKKGNVINVARNHSRVVRCYRCQKLGHTAQNCWNTKRCENCSGEDCSDSLDCSKAPKCVNCNDNHRSSSNRCQAYIRCHEALAAKHSVTQHIRRTSSSSTPQTSVGHSRSTGSVDAQL